VMYSVVTPMLNPFIYSLRNKDMARALKWLFREVTLFWPSFGSSSHSCFFAGVSL
jgi:hypothetical protein